MTSLGANPPAADSQAPGAAAADPAAFHARLASALLASESDAIVACDRDGLITFWNPGAERIFGHPAADALGRSLDLIIPERQRARHWEGYRRVMATGESRYGRGDLLAVPSLRSDGMRISVEFTIVPLKDEAGLMTGMVSVMRDVTARFEEMRALRLKAQNPAGTPAPGKG